MSIKLEHILYPTDFSEFSLHALRHAFGLADAFGATLHCLHVVDEAYQYWSSMGPESIPVGPPPEDLVALAETRMNHFADEHFKDYQRQPITAVRLGRPFAEIIGYAREIDADMIVMATHGRGAIAHMLLGSTTEKVVRKATCAVLTVRGADQEFVMP
jgi:nucleotide-binding universal stress UspA family protein